jgi:ABC-type transport system involved in multi-copper enzyme maturation permease subunit
MTQTWAIFLEAYRNLNSKKLFWLVLILSGLAVVAFACVGINESGLKILFWQFDNNVLNTKQMPADLFYKSMFVQIGIGVWLSWLAAILALISTAGIFPDLLTSGSIELYVSKPIGRLRLFCTEYVAGLLFVALQVTIFSVACFLVIGLRGGVWEPGLFLAVPLVVCFFSYLFSVCVLLGVVTRSTVAALLLTLLFWFVVWAVGTTENTLLMFKTMQERNVDLAAVQAESIQKQQKEKEHDSKSRPEASPSADQHQKAATDGSEQDKIQKAETDDSVKDKPQKDAINGSDKFQKDSIVGSEQEKSQKAQTDSSDQSQKALADDSDKDKSQKTSADSGNQSHVLAIAHRIVYGIKTVLPKTTETIAVLERSLVKIAKLPNNQSQGPQSERMQEAQLEFIEILHARSITWVIGTSLLFEAVILLLAAWVFCRRDY